MLEIIRQLCKSTEQFQHNIIFLFNGAEEVGMLASWGFIQHHRWFKEVKVVINLEAVGAGGKIMLFQTGPHQSWLLDYYRKVPYPYGHAIGEELYQSGLLPAYTDFTNFIYHGNIVGFDFAFIKNGHRYHTKYDTHECIPLESYQHVGANTLSLVKNLANAPELEKSKEELNSQNMVFYDIFSLFLISYSEMVAFIINGVVSLFSITIGIKSFFNLRCEGHSTVRYVLLTFGAILFGWILAAILIVATAFILDAAGFSMSWYNNLWILFGLYITPTITGSLFSIVLLNKFYKAAQNPSVRSQIQIHCTRIIWTIILIVGTAFQLRAVYLIMIPILFETFAFIIIHVTRLQKSVRKWQIIYICSTVFPILYVISQAIILLSFVTAQCGKLDPTTNVELIIAALSLFLTLLICSCYLPLITLVKKSYILVVGLFGIYIIFLIVSFTPLAFPYSGNAESPAPQRFYSYQQTRKFHNSFNETYSEDVVYLVYCSDRNFQSTYTKYIMNFKAEQHQEGLDNTCDYIEDKTISCISSVEPTYPPSINMKLFSKNKIGNAITRFTFNLSGAYWMQLEIKPKPGVSLVGSSLSLKQGTDRYSIVYVFGKETQLNFWIDIQEIDQNTNKPVFDIKLNVNYPYHKIASKNEYDELLETFPSWTVVQPFMIIIETWVY